MNARLPTPQPGHRLAHLTWNDIVPAITNTWPARFSAESPVRHALLTTIDSLDAPASQWRRHVLEELEGGGTARVPNTVEPRATDDAAATALTTAVQTAARTSEDGRQRAVEVEAHSLRVLQDLRKQLRDQICAKPPDSPLRRVLPWLWTAHKSGGRPLSATGERHGYEVRVSRYARPVC